MTRNAGTSNGGRERADVTMIQEEIEHHYSEEREVYGGESCSTKLLHTDWQHTSFWCPEGLLLQQTGRVPRLSRSSRGESRAYIERKNHHALFVRHL